MATTSESAATHWFRWFMPMFLDCHGVGGQGAACAATRGDTVKAVESNAVRTL